LNSRKDFPTCFKLKSGKRAEGTGNQFAFLQAKSKRLAELPVLAAGIRLYIYTQEYSLNKSLILNNYTPLIENYDEKDSF